MRKHLIGVIMALVSWGSGATVDAAPLKLGSGAKVEVDGGSPSTPSGSLEGFPSPRPFELSLDRSAAGSAEAVSGSGDEPAGDPRDLEAETDLAAFDPSLTGVVGEAVGVPVSFADPSAPREDVAEASPDVHLAPNAAQIAIPEPASIVLLLTGMVGLWVRRRLREESVVSQV